MEGEWASLDGSPALGPMPEKTTALANKAGWMDKDEANPALLDA